MTNPNNKNGLTTERRVLVGIELGQRIQPLDYSKMIEASTRALLLGIGRVDNSQVIANHLREHAQTLKTAGITHSVSGLWSFNTDGALAEQGIDTTSSPHKLFSETLSPDSKVFAVLGAYEVLREPIDAYLNHHSLGVTLDRNGLVFINALLTGGKKSMPKEFITEVDRQGLSEQELMVDIRDFRNRRDVPLTLTGLDFLVHIPHINDHD